MAKPIELQRGDPCPACGDALVDAPVPTPEQRAAAENREARQILPAHYDSASEAVRAELGALSFCRTCGYKTRFPLEAVDAAAAGADAGDATAVVGGSAPRRAPRASATK